MRVGIDACLAFKRRRGIGRYVWALLQRLPSLAPSWEFVVYLGRGQPPDGVEWPANVRLRPLFAAPPPIAEQVFLPRAAARDGVDLLHCPGNTGPVLGSAPPLAVTIHDVIYLLPASVLPPVTNWPERLAHFYRRLVVPRLARGASLILTDSRRSKEDILSYLPADPSRLVVVPLAPDPLFAAQPEAGLIQTVKRTYGLGDRVILTTGGTDPRKNLRRLFDAFIRFSSRTTPEYQLVVVGVQGGSRAASIRGEAAKWGKRIVIPGYVPEEHLAVLYHLATVFVYPSVYEGFGLPVLEAMLAGTPVIASNSASIREVAGEAVLFFSATSVEEIAECLERATSDHALRADLMRRGQEWVSQFTWERTAAETLAAYRAVLS